MSIAEIAKKKAAELRAAKHNGGNGHKPVAKKAAAKKSSAKSEKQPRAQRATKVDINWGKVVKMYNEGKSSTEISDAMGFTNSKSNWPYSYTLGLLKRLRAGVNVDGKILKIKPRG
jgi:hypothetical protein